MMIDIIGTTAGGRVGDGISIGSAAARLGVAPETLRSWGTRYGLTPSSRTEGGHRRYSSADLGKLVRMQRLVATGMTPSRAARIVVAEPDDDPAATQQAVSASLGPVRKRPGGPGGRVLAVPGGSAEQRGLARAATRMDAEAMGDILRTMLTERGTIATWEVLRPVLVAVGARWARTGQGVEIEHLLSEVAIDSLRAHRAFQPRPLPGRPVLLACYPEEMHVLPIAVLAAALAEQRVPTRVLGARVPLFALNAAIRRSGSYAVFVWRHLPGEGDLRALDVRSTRPPLRVVLGGNGWEGVPVPPGARRVRTLAEAVEALRTVPR